MPFHVRGSIVIDEATDANYLLSNIDPHWLAAALNAAESRIEATSLVPFETIEVGEHDYEIG